MCTTIDSVGGPVIPEPLRERTGLEPESVEATADGLRIEPVSEDALVEDGGRLVIPLTGTPVDDDLVRMLICADRR